MPLLGRAPAVPPARAVKVEVDSCTTAPNGLPSPTSEETIARTSDVICTQRNCFEPTTHAEQHMPSANRGRESDTGDTAGSWTLKAPPPRIAGIPSFEVSHPAVRAVSAVHAVEAQLQQLRAPHGGTRFATSRPPLSPTAPPVKALPLMPAGASPVTPRTPPSALTTVPTTTPLPPTKWRPGLPAIPPPANKRAASVAVDGGAIGGGASDGGVLGGGGAIGGGGCAGGTEHTEVQDALVDLLLSTDGAYVQELLLEEVPPPWAHAVQVDQEAKRLEDLCLQSTLAERAMEYRHRPASAAATGATAQERDAEPSGRHHGVELVHKPTLRRATSWATQESLATTAAENNVCVRSSTAIRASAPTVLAESQWDVWGRLFGPPTTTPLQRPQSSIAEIEGGAWRPPWGEQPAIKRCRSSTSIASAGWAP